MNKSTHAEMQLIGAAILAVDKHGTIDVSPADFSNEILGRMWKSIQGMREVEPSQLENEFFEQRELIGRAIGSAPSGGTLKKAGALVRSASHKRRVQAALKHAYSIVDNGGDMAEAQAYVMKAFDSVPSDSGWRSLGELCVPAYMQVETAQRTGIDTNFVKTGFVDFDTEFGGLQKNGLVIVAGRPSMGKTAFASTLAFNAGKTLFVSLEMSGMQLAMRYYASQGGVDLQNMMQGKLTAADWGKMVGVQSKLMDSGVFINDRTSRTISDVCAEARRFKLQHPDMAMLVVDYLTLLDLPESQNKNEAVSTATRMLKCLAGELAVPVVLLSQLNRTLENRKDKRPIMADLRDSGAIEQDADQIIFPFRPEVYEPDDENLKGVALVNLAKNRNGSTGTVKMTWLAVSATFKDAGRGRCGSE